MKKNDKELIVLNIADYRKLLIRELQGTQERGNSFTLSIY